MPLPSKSETVLERDVVGEISELPAVSVSIGNCERAIEYHEKNLSIAKEVRDRAREGLAIGNRGLVR